MRLKKALVAMVSIVMFTGGALSTTPAHAVTNGYSASSDTVADSIAKLRFNTINCSAVMISPSWALTAKHCIEPLSSSEVPGALGSSEVPGTLSLRTGIDLNGEKYTAKIYPHPNTDLALLNINGVHKGTIAELPQKEAQLGDTIKAVGFGGSGQNINSAQYIKGTLNKGGWGEAKIVDSGIVSGFFLNFDNVGHGELRKGDSGGGGFIGNELHGIFANGRLNNNKVFTRDINYVYIYHYLDWIYDTTGIVSTPSGQNEIQYDYFSNNYTNPTVTDNGAYESPIINNSSNFIFGSTS